MAIENECKPNIALLRRYFLAIGSFDKDEVPFDEKKYSQLKEKCKKWDVDITHVANFYWIMCKISSDNADSFQRWSDSSRAHAKLKSELNIPIDQITGITIHRTNGKEPVPVTRESELFFRISELVTEFSRDGGEYCDERTDMRRYQAKRHAHDILQFLKDQDIGKSTDDRYFIGGWLLCLAGLRFSIQRDGTRQIATEDELEEQDKNWFKDNFKAHMSSKH